jgi:hypothetical protein
VCRLGGVEMILLELLCGDKRRLGRVCRTRECPSYGRYGGMGSSGLFVRISLVVLIVLVTLSLTLSGRSLGMMQKTHLSLLSGRYPGQDQCSSLYNIEFYGLLGHGTFLLNFCNNLINLYDNYKLVYLQALKPVRRPAS